MRALSKKRIDPRDHDYNKDGRVTESDWDVGKKDLNKDGKVTPQEEKRYDKQQTTTTSETTVKDGDSTTTVKTPPPEPEGPKWSRGEQQRAGFTREFLKRHPEVAKILKDAIEFNYTEEEFMDIVLTQTKWGQSTFEAQRKFDLQYYGKDSTGIKNTLQQNRDNIALLASNAGVTLTKEELDDFAFRFTRSALTSNDIYDFISRRYGVRVQEATTPEQQAEVARKGTAAEIADEIRALARVYGIELSESNLNKKIQEGLRQGDNWERWVQGQRNIFRQSAKSMYPAAADQLDDYTLEELADSYMDDAANLLGIDRTNMSLTDNKWLRALSGPDGKPMTREQWLATLRTDKRYGWTKTQKAKSEMAELGSELLSVFGMA